MRAEIEFLFLMAAFMVGLALVGYSIAMKYIIPMAG